MKYRYIISLAIIVFLGMTTFGVLAENFAPMQDSENVKPGKAPPLESATKAMNPLAQAQGAGEPAAAPEKIYKVVGGDSLYTIAAMHYGNGNRWQEIVNANKDKYPSLVSNPSLIVPGWELVIPDAGENSDSKDYTTPEEGTVEVGSSLNIRSEPWGKVLGSFHNGDKIQIIGKKGDWYKISYNGGTAYVHANYVSTSSKPAGQTPVQTPSQTPDGQAAPDPTITPGNGRFGAAPCSPMPNHVSSEYGPRELFVRSFLSGIDLPVPNGTRLNALGDGVVISSGYESGGGRFLTIRYDNGIQSFYCHLQNSSVREGQRVSMGQEVARSDNTGQWTTGAHLHMGIKVNGSYVNPRSIKGLPLP